MRRWLVLGAISLITAAAHGQHSTIRDTSHPAVQSAVHSRTHNRPSGWGDCGARTGQKGCRDPFLRRRHRAHGDHDGYEQPSRKHLGQHIKKNLPRA